LCRGLSSGDRGEHFARRPGPAFSGFQKVDDSVSKRPKCDAIRSRCLQQQRRIRHFEPRCFLPNRCRLFDERVNWIESRLDKTYFEVKRPDFAFSTRWYSAYSPGLAFTLDAEQRPASPPLLELGDLRCDQLPGDVGVLSHLASTR
jgi:hypothetical protein